MFFNNNRASIRQAYYDSWRKYKNREILNPTEAIICEVIKEHPEYHATIENTNSVDKDFTPESGLSNPFLHMGLHIAIREQLTTNRPVGIKNIFTELVNKYGNSTKVEHLIMENLVEIIMVSQKLGIPPDEEKYLKNLKNLLNS